MMDWKSFFATMTEHLVWPAVVAYVIYLLRNELTGLANRLEEVSGAGLRAKFVGELKKAQGIDLAPALEETMLPQATPADQTKAILEKEAPFASVLVGYAELERILLQIRDKLSLAPRTNLISIVRELAKRDMVPEEAVEAFNALRLARNAAAHAQTTITESDASNFNFTARRLRNIFQTIADSSH